MPPNNKVDIVRRTPYSVYSPYGLRIGVDIPTLHSTKAHGVCEREKNSDEVISQLEANIFVTATFG